DLFQYVHGKCPVCGGTIAKDKATASGDDEVAWRCQNIAGCPAQLTRRVEYFAQRKALDLESLGGIVAEKLVERGLVKEPLDLFDLKLEVLGKLNLGTDDEPRVFGEKNATKILDALQRAKTAPLSRWILALGIPNVGEVTAIDLGKFHQDLEEVAHSKMLSEITDLGALYSSLPSVSPFVDGITAAEKLDRRELFKTKKQVLLDVGNRMVKKGWVHKSDRWTKLENNNSKAVPTFLPLIDYVPAENVLCYFKSEIGQKLLARLKVLQINPRSDLTAPSHGPLTSTTFVLTGTLPTLSRDEASALIRDAGGNVTGSVSKNTDYLLAGEEAGSKLDKAKELGVKILSEKDFLDLLRPKPKPDQKQQSDLFLR
ncbi:MAG: BRCT domain-containing protein, partial [Verrucomicrobiota bacterium]